MRSPFKYLRVWPEFASSGIWAIDSPFQRIAGGMVEYKYLGLPEDLVRDFQVWQDWYEEWLDHQDAFDWEGFNARGLELARRLNRVLGQNQYVEYQGSKVELDNLELEGVVIPKRFKEPFPSGDGLSSVICLAGDVIERFKRAGSLSGKDLESREADGELTPGTCLVMAAEPVVNAIDADIGVGLDAVLETSFLGRFSGEADGILTLANAGSLKELLPLWSKLELPERSLLDVRNEFGVAFPSEDFCGKYRECDCGVSACGSWFAWMADGVCLFYLEVNGTWVNDARILPFRLKA